MRTHLADSEIPDDAIAKVIPRDNLVRTGRWEHPSGFKARVLDPFRQKVAQVWDAPFSITAYSSIDEANIILLARPLGSPEIE